MSRLDPAVARRVTAAATRLAAAHEELGHARRQLFAALERRAELGGRQTAVHGTPAMYRQHQRAGDLACQPCLIAYSWDARRRVSHRNRQENS